MKNASLACIINGFSFNALEISIIRQILSFLTLLKQGCPCTKFVAEVLRKIAFVLNYEINLSGLISMLSSMTLVCADVDAVVHAVIISMSLISISNSTFCVFGIISCGTPCCEVYSHWVNPSHSRQYWRKAEEYIISHKCC